MNLLILLAPELTLALGATVILMLGLSRSPALRSSLGFLSTVTILAALAMSLYAPPETDPEPHLGVALTWLGWYTRIVALSIGLLVLLVNVHLPADEDRGDVFAMILYSLTGILLTALADDLVLLFMAIELVSAPTYVLVSISRGNIRAQESGVKYFFLGALSAALLAYGFSFLYGASGTTVLSEMAFDADNGYLAFGLMLAFAGVAFKIAAVPFHAYAADVYHGAASSITALLGFVPKLAGFIALVKLMVLLQPAGPATAGWGLPEPAFYFLWIVAAATMTIGNVLGLMQDNVKRMLAYSSIAHSGYMLIAVLVGPVADGGPMRDGLSAMLFYMVAYGVMNLGAFAVLAMIRSGGRDTETLDDLHGLWRQQPLAALAMAVCVFSLMGMPLTAGFFGKVYIFSGALSAGAAHPYQVPLIVLAVIGVLNAAVAAAYYLRIVAACYLGEPAASIVPVARTFPLRVGLAVCCIAILVIGLWPTRLINMVRQPSIAIQHGRPGLVEQDRGGETAPAVFEETLAAAETPGGTAGHRLRALPEQVAGR